MKRMRWLALTAVLTFFAAASITGAGKPRQQGDAVARPEQLKKGLAEQIIALEKQGWEDLKKHDIDPMARLLAEDYVAIDEDGPVDKAGNLKQLANLVLNDYTLDNIKVTVFSPDAVLLTYKGTSKGTYQGQDLGPKPYYYGSLYVRRGGQWLNVFTQETRSR